MVRAVVDHRTTRLHWLSEDARQRFDPLLRGRRGAHRVDVTRHDKLAKNSSPMSS
jgi:hypothetical protein